MVMSPRCVSASVLSNFLMRSAMLPASEGFVVFSLESLPGRAMPRMSVAMWRTERSPSPTEDIVKSFF